MNWTIRIALVFTLAASFGAADAYAHCGKHHADNDALAHCGDCSGDDAGHDKKTGECDGKDGKDCDCKDSTKKDAKTKTAKDDKGAKDEGSCHSKGDKDAA